jgi:hypothetical protein
MLRRKILIGFVALRGATWGLPFGLRASDGQDGKNRQQKFTRIF